MEHGVGTRVSGGIRAPGRLHLFLWEQSAVALRFGDRPSFLCEF